MTRSVVLASLLLLFSMSVTPAATIEFFATNLFDVTPGEDLWRYDYKVSGHTFAQSEYFETYFDPALYGELTAGPAPDGDWDVVILQQPDPLGLPPFDIGMFNAFALADGPSLALPFSVLFVYLGAGTPGPQPFLIFDANSEEVGSGLTAESRFVLIPESSTAALSLAGLVAFALHTYLRTTLRR